MRLIAIFFLLLVVLAVFAESKTDGASKSQTDVLSPSSRSKPATTLEKKKVSGKRRLGKVLKQCRADCAKTITTQQTEADQQRMRECVKQCAHEKAKKKQEQKAKA